MRIFRLLEYEKCRELQIKHYLVNGQSFNKLATIFGKLGLKPIGKDDAEGMKKSQEKLQEFLY